MLQDFTDKKPAVDFPVQMQLFSTLLWPNTQKQQHYEIYSPC